jgi:uroporphyrinogen-III synthase
VNAARSLNMSAEGQKRRLAQWKAAPRLPLYAVGEQTRAALQYVAMGHDRK